MYMNVYIRHDDSAKETQIQAIPIIELGGPSSDPAAEPEPTTTYAISQYLLRQSKRDGSEFVNL